MARWLVMTWCVRCGVAGWVWFWAAVGYVSSGWDVVWFVARELCGVFRGAVGGRSILVEDICGRLSADEEGLE